MANETRNKNLSLKPNVWGEFMSSKNKYLVDNNITSMTVSEYMEILLDLGCEQCDRSVKFLNVKYHEDVKAFLCDQCYKKEI